MNKDYYKLQLDKIIFGFKDILFLENEIFSELEGTEGKYFISSRGNRIISFCKNDYKFLMITTRPDGYQVVDIKGLSPYVHRLVFAAFVNADISDKEVHHIDGNRANNSIENLCALSPEKHKVIHSLQKRFEKNLVLFEGDTP